MAENAVDWSLRKIMQAITEGDSPDRIRFLIEAAYARGYTNAWEAQEKRLA